MIQNNLLKLKPANITELDPSKCGFFNDNNGCSLNEKCRRDHKCFLCSEKHSLDHCPSLKAINASLSKTS